MLNHFQGILLSEQTEPKLFDLAFETGHNEAFPAQVPQLLHASAELVSILELQSHLSWYSLHFHPSQCFLLLAAQFNVFFFQEAFLSIIQRN